MKSGAYAQQSNLFLNEHFADRVVVLFVFIFHHYILDQNLPTIQYHICL
jgi:hypothetical protein